MARAPLDSCDLLCLIISAEVRIAGYWAYLRERGEAQIQKGFISPPLILGGIWVPESKKSGLTKQ